MGMTIAHLPENHVVEKYLSGHTIRAIADHYGVGTSSIGRVIKKHGIETRSVSDYDNGWCTSLPTDDAVLRREYESGLPISKISKRHGIGFGTVRRRLIACGTELRANSTNQFNHFLPEWIRLYVDEKRSLKFISARYEVDYATVRRYLINAHVAMRADSSVPVYLHDSPACGLIRVRGSWEKKYAQILDIWFADGRISGWAYEADKIRFSYQQSHITYIPDFKVTSKDGVHSYHEIKGYLRGLSGLKIHKTRELGIPVVLVTGRILSALCCHYGLRIKV